MCGSAKWLAIVLGGYLYVFVGQAAWGARLLEIRVEREGKTVLKGMTQDESQTDAAGVWGFLRHTPLRAVSEVPADPVDPVWATLMGDIRVVILHAGQPVAESRVRELRLVRASPHTDLWQLAPGEVARTADVAGIRSTQPSAENSSWSLTLVGGFAAGALVVVGVAVWVTRKRGGPPDSK